MTYININNGYKQASLVFHLFYDAFNIMFCSLITSLFVDYDNICL